MRTFFSRSLLVLAVAATTVYAATTLSPNQNNQSGTIPSGYDDLIFQLSNGNWVPNLTLPLTAKDGAKLSITSSAGYDSQLDATRSDVPVAQITVKAGNTFNFIFSLASGKWQLQSKVYTPNANGAVMPVPATTDFLSTYKLADANWVPEVTLPASAVDGQFVSVQSTATWASKINTQNVLFPSSFTVKTGDRYYFRYVAALSQWVPESSPTRVISPAALGSQTASTITSPINEVTLTDTDLMAAISLPASANDRDQVIVKSATDRVVHINNAHTNTLATLNVKRGDQYTFRYIADKAYWIVQSSPTPLFQLKDVPSGQLPATATPVTEVKAADANWQPTLQLPLTAQEGDRVILRSTATYSVNVVSGSLAERVYTGENVRFIYNAQHQWQRETRLITMLLTYNSAVLTTLGDSAAKLKMIESLRLANEGAENSHLNYYVKQVGGLFQRDLVVPDQDLLTALSVAKSDAAILNERKRVKADAVAYFGRESISACGWANVYADVRSMYTANDLGCGVTVMRHEFGHNMGSNHNTTHEEAVATHYLGYGFAHPLGSTIMGGNSLPYYSSPDVYSPQYGVRLGVANEVDASQVLNGHSAAVSDFHNQLTYSF
ncbi:zinc-dependent metalloprotease family protein [Aquirhabdus parva]|uniref:Metallopeptidase n=1 Tax=Aquirhabdus parva TaxID=2283318 RepID=A0A345P9K6_9GAMM|nr:zinc-dependent metalloprotease family protein [Aquirhabdus parva]AXI03965.1 metallopeptidase [Aquirhabdus parva]